MVSIKQAAHTALVTAWVRRKEHRRSLIAEGDDVLRAIHTNEAAPLTAIGQTDEKVAPGGGAAGRGAPGAMGRAKRANGKTGAG